MYDNELAVAIQSERERAIREARLHHRADLPVAVTKLVRLRSAVAALVRAVARQRVPDPTPPVAGQLGRPTAACGSQANGSRVAPG